jgi:hypothetical protein
MSSFSQSLYNCGWEFNRICHVGDPTLEQILCPYQGWQRPEMSHDIPGGTRNESIFSIMRSEVLTAGTSKSIVLQTATLRTPVIGLPAF